MFLRQAKVTITIQTHSIIILSNSGKNLTTNYRQQVKYDLTLETVSFWACTNWRRQRIFQRNFRVIITASCSVWSSPYGKLYSLIKFFIYFVIYAKYDPMNHIQGGFNRICCVILGKTGRLWCHVISPWYFPYNGEIKFKPYEKKKNKSAVF